MLKLSECFSSVIIQNLIVMRISKYRHPSEKVVSIRTKFQIAAVNAVMDAFIVGGISFFASLAALGYSNLLVNIEVCLYSSVTMAGLAFFNDMKQQFKN